MAALVAEDEKNFVVGETVCGRIPHHEALGGADAGYIRIEAVAFGAGLHQKHAVGGDVRSGAGDDGFQFRNQRGMSLGERFELVEDGIEQRRREDGEHDQRQSEQPDTPPVASRVSADQPVEKQQNRRAEEDREAQALAQIFKPASPALHADAVVAADHVADCIQRQAGQGGNNQKDGEEEQSLEPAPARNALSPCGQTRGPARGEQQPEDGNAPERSNDAEGGADVAEGDGFGQFVGRQGVSLRAGGLRWGWRWLKGRRGLGRCSLRREARNLAGEQQGKAEHQQISSRK